MTDWVDYSLQLEQQSENFWNELTENSKRLRRRPDNDCIYTIATVGAYSIRFQKITLTFEHRCVFLAISCAIDCSRGLFHFLILLLTFFFRDFTWIFIDFWEKLAFTSLFSLAWNLEYFLLWTVRTAVLGLLADFSLFRCWESYFYLIAILAFSNVSGLVCFLVLIQVIEPSGFLGM